MWFIALMAIGLIMTTRAKISEQKASLTVMTAKIIILLSKYPEGVRQSDLALFKPSKHHTQVFKQAIRDLADGAIITRDGDIVKLNEYTLGKISEIVTTDSDAEI